MNDKTIISVEDLSVIYPDGTRGADQISFRLSPRDRLAVVGESGSGKTTIIRSILRLLPDGTTMTGKIRFNGSNLVSLKEKKMQQIRGKQIGYISQDPSAACNPVFSVINHVAEAWKAHKESIGKNRIIRQLARLGISDAKTQAKLYPHQWSGGMLQRAEVAAASARNPGLILADEPTSALDAELAHHILNLITTLESAVLIITHDIRLVADYVQNIAVCYAGRILETGTAQNIMASPRHPYSKVLIASSGRYAGDLPLTLDHAMPDLKTNVSGCGFASRCPVVMEDCHLIRPILRDGVACLRYQQSGFFELPLNRNHENQSQQFQSANTPIISLENVSKQYNSLGKPKKVLNKINLQLFPGEILGVSGPSGEGKSTLLKIIAGIESPSGGMVFHNQMPVWRLYKTKAKRQAPQNGFVMSVFQNPYTSLDPRWPIWKIITEPTQAPHRNMRPNRIERIEMAKQSLSDVGLSFLSGTERPAELSIGQCQRISILRALIAKPQVLAADEPTSALDVTTAVGIYRLLKKAAAENTAIVIVSHDREALKSICDRVVQIRKKSLTPVEY